MAIVAGTHILHFPLSPTTSHFMFILYSMIRAKNVIYGKFNIFPHPLGPTTRNKYFATRVLVHEMWAEFIFLQIFKWNNK